MAKENLLNEGFSMDAFISDDSLITDMQEIFEKIEPITPVDDEDQPDDEKKPDIKADPAKKEENVGKEKSVEIPAKTEETKSSSTVSANKLYSSFAKSLKDKGGIFQALEIDEEKGISTFDDLNEKIEALIQKRLDESLDDFQKEFKEALNIGMPTDEFKELQGKIEQLNNIPDDYLEGDSEDNVKFRYSVIKNNLMLQGIKEDKADKLARASIKDETDVEDAKEALKEMQEHYQKEYKSKKDEYKNLSKKKEEEEKTILTKFEEKINSTNEIAGFKLDESLRKKIYDNTTKVVAKKEGRPLNALMKARIDNPEEFDLKLNWLHIVTKGFSDFSYFTGKGKKEAVSEFDKLLQTASNKNGIDLSAEENYASFLDNIDDTETIYK